MEGPGRVLGIVASPHCSGNTATLVKEVLKGAVENGYETELLCLGDLNINPLIACASDEPYGVTGPEDDMELIYSSLEGIRCLVFGTPIFFDHISARAKIFIDRLIYYSKGDTKDRFPKHVKVVIIATYAWKKPEAYSNVVEWLKDRLEYYGAYWKLQVTATLQAENTLKEPVADRSNLLRKARQIGRTLSY